MFSKLNPMAEEFVPHSLYNYHRHLFLGRTCWHRDSGFASVCCILILLIYFYRNKHYVQLVVEKMLVSKGIKRADLGIEEFTKRVWEWKEKYGGTITNQIRRLGASCDWTREHFTLDEQLSQAVIEAFIKLHEKGLIYQGSYMVVTPPRPVRSVQRKTFRDIGRGCHSRGYVRD